MRQSRGLRWQCSAKPPGRSQELYTLLRRLKNPLIIIFPPPFSRFHVHTLLVQACIANPRNAEALLLKGFILLDLKKLQDAAFHFREALNIAPYRYKPHKGLWAVCLAFFTGDHFVCLY